MADHIIDLAIYRAILHGAAAGACSVAARETGSAYWAATAREQSGKAAERLTHGLVKLSCQKVVCSDQTRA